MIVCKAPTFEKTSSGSMFSLKPFQILPCLHLTIAPDLYAEGLEYLLSAIRLQRSAFFSSKASNNKSLSFIILICK